MTHRPDTSNERMPADSIGQPAMAEAAAAHEVVFKAVTSNGVRHGLKLERLYWDMIEAAAAGAKERPNVYVARVLATARAGQNKSSWLRVHAASWVRRKLIELSSASFGRHALRNIVIAAPMPCFFVTSKNVIETQNEHFMTLLRSLSQTAEDASPEIRITFQSGIAKLRNAYQEKPNSVLVDTISLHVGRQTTLHKANIAMMDSINGQPLGLLVFLTK